MRAVLTDRELRALAREADTATISSEQLIAMLDERAQLLEKVRQIEIRDELFEEGIWQPCTGCHESDEGHPTGPYSGVFRCHLGSGCHECGGIGAVWTAFADMPQSEADFTGHRVIVDFEHGVISVDEAEYTHRLQRSVFELIELAKQHGLNDNTQVNQAKELIRCRVLGCGMAGACDGQGGDHHPCPLRK